jgi:hydroxypyruvate isomerase
LIACDTTPETALPQLAANLSLLFADRPFLERFGAAARAGFRAVEFQFPYDWPLEALQHELQTHPLKAVLHNLPAGDWAAGDRGLACDPGRVERIPGRCAAGHHLCARPGRAAIELPGGRAAAGRVGRRGPGHAAGQPAFRRRRAGAAWLDAADRAHQHLGCARLLRQPHRAGGGAGEAVGAPNLKVQYDVYHAQRMEGELAATLQRHWPHIGHVQIADNPGRHEPGTGEMNYRFLFDCLDRWGYEGHVGCEYRPALDGPGGTEAGLSWVQGHGLQIGGMA